MKKLILFLLFISFNFGHSQEVSSSLSNNKLEGIKIDEVQRPPIYPGCQKKKNKSSLAKCLNQKIGKHVSKNFDTKSFNVSKGKYKIKTIFNIDINGKITDIKVLAPYPMMEEEAIRVISSIPDMLEPGYQEEKPVVISYFLPINFVVENGSR